MRKRSWSIYIRKQNDKYSAHMVSDDNDCGSNVGTIAATCLTYKEACEYEELFNRIFKGGVS